MGVSTTAGQHGRRAGRGGMGGWGKRGEGNRGGICIEHVTNDMDWVVYE